MPSLQVLPPTAAPVVRGFANVNNSCYMASLAQSLAAVQHRMVPELGMQHYCCCSERLAGGTCTRCTLGGMMRFARYSGLEVRGGGAVAVAGMAGLEAVRM